MSIFDCKPNLESLNAEGAGHTSPRATPWVIRRIPDRALKRRIIFDIFATTLDIPPEQFDRLVLSRNERLLLRHLPAPLHARFPSTAKASLSYQLSRKMGRAVHLKISYSKCMKQPPLDHPEKITPFQLALLILTILVLLALVVDTLAPVNRQVSAVIQTLDTIVCVLFFTD